MIEGICAQNVIFPFYQPPAENRSYESRFAESKGLRNVSPIRHELARSRRAAIIELMHRAGVVYYPCLACLVFGLTLRAESCGDIAKVDFRNHVIVAAHYSTEPDYRMSNGLDLAVRSVCIMEYSYNGTFLQAK